MNTVAMNLGSPGVENVAVNSEEYGDELMFAGWNPQVAAVVKQSLTVFDGKIALMTGVTNADSDFFLKRIYEYQR